MNDLRYALRTLRRRPGFAFAAIVSIGLAIGANAAIFSLADAFFLRPLEVPDPFGVVTFATRPSTDDGRLSYPEYLDVRDANRSFAGLAAVQVLRAGLARDANTQPELKIGFAATADLFETFRVVPRLGRGFRPEENLVPRRNAVVVLGEDCGGATSRRIRRSLAGRCDSMGSISKSSASSRIRSTACSIWRVRRSSCRS